MVKLIIPIKLIEGLIPAKEIRGYRMIGADQLSFSWVNGVVARVVGIISFTISFHPAYLY